MVQDKCRQTCSYAYNSFESPPLNGLSPFQLNYDRPQKFWQKYKLIYQKVLPDLSKYTTEVHAEALGASLGEAATGADLGGSSKYSKGLHIIRKYYKIVDYNRWHGEQGYTNDSAQTRRFSENVGFPPN